MILIRHGQSEFNAHHDVTGEDPGIPDPGLTDLGRRQVTESAARLKNHPIELKRVLTSPYTRAIETAEIVARTLDLPIEVEPLVHERAFYQCDIGTPRSKLAAAWPTLSFDHLPETWWPNLDETHDQVELRCTTFHANAAALKDWQHVVVASHWAFILQLTGYSAQNGELVPYDPTQMRRATRAG